MTLRPFVTGLALFLVVGVVHSAISFNEVYGSSGRQLDKRSKSTLQYGADIPWNAVNYNDSWWNTTTPSFSYSPGSLPMYSVFIRCAFQAEPRLATQPFNLAISWGDGYVAYINEFEVSRANMGPKGMFSWYDQEAMNSRSSTKREVRRLATGFELQQGQNTFGLQIHRRGTNKIRTDFNLTVATGEKLIVSTTKCRYVKGFMQPSGQVFDSISPRLPGVTQGSFVDSSDWLELYNNDSTSVNLSNYSLTDNKDNPRKWVFPTHSLSLIKPNGFLRVLCDELNYIGTYLHTNFNLDTKGGSLFLYDRNLAMIASLDYPVQSAFFSYGRDQLTNTWKYFFPATPDLPNVPLVSKTATVKKPSMSLRGGLVWSTSAVISMTCSTSGALIYYTNDTSEPTEESTLYTGPLTLMKTTVLRAKAFLSGFVPSVIATETYLFNQSPLLKSALVFSLVGDNNKTMYKPEGVLAIQGGTYAKKDGAEPWRQTNSSAYHEYHMPRMRGDAFKRIMSLQILFNQLYGQEDLDPIDIDVSFSASDLHRAAALFFDGSIDGQVDVFSPWNQTSLGGSKMPSYLFAFRSEYGGGRFNRKFSDLSELVMQKRLRMRGTRKEPEFLIDEYTRRLFYDMGHTQNVGAVASFFFNGVLKGLFNPAEKLDKIFLSQSKYVAESSMWDIYNVRTPYVDEGDDAFFKEMRDFTFSRNLSIATSYRDFINKYLDIDSFVDYLLLETWTASEDWVTNNVQAYRLRNSTSALSKLQMIVWDCEKAWMTVTENLFTGRLKSYKFGTKSGLADLMGGLYNALLPSAEFKLRFADRYYKHFFNDGVFTPSSMIAKYDALYNLSSPLKKLIYGVDLKRTKFDKFMNLNPSIGRWKIYEGQIKALGLWQDSLKPPVPSVRSKVSPAPFSVTLSKSNSAANVAIYYALGKDPRDIGGASASATLYNGPVAIDNTTSLCARTFNGTLWSPVDCVHYLVKSALSLTITEIMWKPFGGSDFEFVELKNFGSRRILLEYIQLWIDGTLGYEFPEGFSLEPNRFVVLASNPDTFVQKYAIPPTARFIGNGLKKASRFSFVFKPTKTELWSVSYNSTAEWPAEAKSGGKSLVPTSVVGLDELSQSSYLQWRASVDVGGSPGRDDN